MLRPNRRATRRGVLSALLALTALQGCTDLGEDPFSAITPDSFYKNDDEVRSGIAAVYNAFNTVSTGNYHYINTISSDEQVIPVRGQDWFDNGTHLESQRQLWQPGSPSGLGTVNSAWNQAQSGVARANVLLEAIEPQPIANKARTIAEVRLLRAYFYYVLMDLFGGVPIVTDSKIEPRERATRAQLFQFIEKELNEARADLPVSWPASEYGRVTRGAADALLASMYLNAEVFTGTVSANGLQKGQPRWQDAVSAADRIIGSGQYSLTPDWFANFRANNHLSPEMIFVSARRPEAGVSLNFISDRLHYNQFSPAPNNGRAAEPPTYRKFDPADLRRTIFLVGPQNHLVTGAPVNDRSGARLVYQLDFRDITQATEGEGARVYKWPFDPNRSTTNHGNDFPIFRLAEILLIKAEALNELGRTAEALQLVNQVRARTFEPDKPLVALSQAQLRDAILDERLFELMDEAKRRADLIRHGKWTAPWFAKEQREPYRILMPIPQTQMDANPLLTQNPGY